MNHGIRVDGPDPLRHDLDLVTADGVHGRDDLAVEVGQGDGIIVHNIQGPDAAARQRLHDIAADTADTEDGDPGGSQSVHGHISKQHPAS